MAAVPFLSILCMHFQCLPATREKDSPARALPPEADQDIYTVFLKKDICDYRFVSLYFSSIRVFSFFSFLIEQNPMIVDGRTTLVEIRHI
jgi:hypothetical protein